MKYSNNIPKFTIDEVLDEVYNDNICVNGLKIIREVVKVFKGEENLVSEKNFNNFIKIVENDEEAIEWLLENEVITESIGFELPELDDWNRMIYRNKKTKEVYMIITTDESYYTICGLTLNFTDGYEESDKKELLDFIGEDPEILEHIKITKDTKKGKK